MTHHTLHHNYVIAQLIVPISFTLSIFSLRILRQISKSILYVYIFGIGLSLLWEIPIHIAGKTYIQYPYGNPLGHWTLPLNCIWNSIIFILGLYLVHIRNYGKWCGLLRLFCLIVWCVLLQFLTQFITDGNYSVYNKENKYNPIIFTYHGITYTSVPYLLWICMSILYLTGVFSIIEKYGSLRKERTIHFADSTQSLSDNNDSDQTLTNQREIGSVI